MMKKQIAMMLCFAAGAVKAQSGVTLYGVIDTPIEYVNHVAAGAPTADPVTGRETRQAGGTRVGLQNNSGLSGSRWGVRGVEDLGGGLQALFALESGFGPADGRSDSGGRLFGRQAFVGLQFGEYGKLTFGRQYTSLTSTLGNFSPLAFANLYEPIFAEVGLNFREDNTVKYSGNFGGLTAEAHWSFGAGTGVLGTIPLAGNGAGESPGHFRDNSAYGAGLSYSAGPVGVAVAYDQWNPAITPGNAGAAKKVAVAGSYAVGPALFMVGYRWGRDADSAGRTLIRDNYYWFGASYQATHALQFLLAYYYDDVKSIRVQPSSPQNNPANPWQLTFVTDYNLSKRTDIYLTMAYVKNSGLNFDTSAVAYVNGYALPPGGNSQVGVALGIRHKF